MYETEDIPNRNKLWLLSTLASFIVLVTAVLWTLWWDLSRENFFLGVYLADTLYLLISGTWYRIQAKPMFSSSVAELTWVLWDSSWGWWVFARISLQSESLSTQPFIPPSALLQEPEVHCLLKCFSTQPCFLCLLSKKPLFPTNNVEYVILSWHLFLESQTYLFCSFSFVICYHST